MNYNDMNQDGRVDYADQKLFDMYCNPNSGDYVGFNSNQPHYNSYSYRMNKRKSTPEEMCLMVGFSVLIPLTLAVFYNVNALFCLGLCVIEAIGGLVLIMKAAKKADAALNSPNRTTATTAQKESEEDDGLRFICDGCGNKSTGWYQKCPNCGKIGQMHRISQ